MKSTDKINDKILKDLLSSVEIEQGEDKIDFYCRNCEKQIDVKLNGNQLKHLLEFIKNHFYDVGYGYGKKAGNREKIAEIKNVLDIK